MPQKPARADTSIHTYRAKRDFTVTAEPPPREAISGETLSFVVQKHAARRAGLHYDFRLEHGGVMWSWAIPKGPSLDPAARHAAFHVEDHPIDYAAFEGTIPEGQYGAGKVETWDRGTWRPLIDPEAGMRKGDLKFTLAGQRLRGEFALVRMRGRPNEKSEPWLLIKKRDGQDRAGLDAEAIEAERPLTTSRKPRTEAPAKGAKKAALPASQAPELASLTEAPPDGEAWLSEIKLDGYRLLVWLDAGKVTIRTRKGLDWTDRLPAVAAQAAHFPVQSALLDGELVALRADGASSFPKLQEVLSAGRDDRLFFFIFDLLFLDGWDLRPCALIDRKAVLQKLSTWNGMLRYCDHLTGGAEKFYDRACQMKLEGIIAKRASAPYRAGRGKDWLKVKCRGREEFAVLGWTPPAGARVGFGALHLGYYDADGLLHYAGGVGTGFDTRELNALKKRLDELATDVPAEIQVSGDPLDRSIHWVRPELVAEIEYADWSGSGRIRHAVYLGLREDKPACEVVRAIADPEAVRKALHRAAAAVPPGKKFAIPPRQEVPAMPNKPGARIVVARAPQRKGETIEGIALSHPDRELWPGITKRDLAAYWQAIAEHALPEIAKRPLAIVRCPDGIHGEKFFQKNTHGIMPAPIRDGKAGGQPYLAIDDLAGLVALAQMSAIEIHAWGATEAEPTHPDRIVFDLDPGEGVPFPEIVTAALEVRDRLRRLGLIPFCRTTGGKGLHVVVPLIPRAGWEQVKPWCRAFAELMSQEQPQKYLPTMSKADRRGRILIDWLRNGMGATAISSFCPRARPGATVATPLAWDEVTPQLDPTSFTVHNVPARARTPAWEGFDAAARPLPEPAAKAVLTAQQPKESPVRSRIVVAKAPKRRSAGR
jgi:bifunctional non-homologous end joining protein LigD